MTSPEPKRFVTLAELLEEVFGITEGHSGGRYRSAMRFLQTYGSEGLFADPPKGGTARLVEFEEASKILEEKLSAKPVGHRAAPLASSTQEAVDLRAENIAIHTEALELRAENARLKSRLRKSALAQIDETIAKLEGLRDDIEMI